MMMPWVLGMDEDMGRQRKGEPLKGIRVLSLVLYANTLLECRTAFGSSWFHFAPYKFFLAIYA